jgi:hypothetical protein
MSICRVRYLPIFIVLCAHNTRRQTSLLFSAVVCNLQIAIIFSRDVGTRVLAAVIYANGKKSALNINKQFLCNFALMIAILCVLLPLLARSLVPSSEVSVRRSGYFFTACICTANNLFSAVLARLSYRRASLSLSHSFFLFFALHEIFPS